MPSDPSLTRHERMFELLRQAHQATRTAERVERFAGNPAHQQAARDFRDLALASLREPPIAEAAHAERPGVWHTEPQIWMKTA